MGCFSFGFPNCTEQYIMRRVIGRWRMGWVSLLSLQTQYSQYSPTSTTLNTSNCALHVYKLHTACIQIASSHYSRTLQCTLPRQGPRVQNSAHRTCGQKQLKTTAHINSPFSRKGTDTVSTLGSSHGKGLNFHHAMSPHWQENI